MDLERISGNLLTQEEKDIWIKELYEYHLKEDLDLDFLPYLERINAVPFVCTTQSCTGHGKSDAYFRFRCSKSPEWVIDNLFKPLEQKFKCLGFSLMELGQDKLTYRVWIFREECDCDWWEPVEYFISLLELAEERELPAKKLVEKYQPRQLFVEITTTIEEVMKIAPKNIIEVGIWDAGSLGIWFELIWEGGTLIGIDPVIRPLAAERIHEFRKSPKKVAVYIIENQGQSDKTQKILNWFKADFIFIDGDHDRTVQDYRLFMPYLQEGGLMAIHDFKKYGALTHQQLNKDGWDRFYLFGSEEDTWGMAYIWKSKTGKYIKKGIPPLWAGK